MKLDQRTITILKNFAGINNGLSVKKGNVISTINAGRSVLAKATVKDDFSEGFAIYELNRFLATLSLFEEPELDLHEKHMTISDGKQSVNYTYCEEEFILTPPDKKLDIENGDIQFHLTGDTLQSLLKASAVMKLPNISVTGDGSSVMIEAFDAKNPTSDVFSILVGESNSTFKVVFKTELFRMINDNYDVQISKSGIAQFTASDIIYWIAVERELSSFS